MKLQILIYLLLSIIVGISTFKITSYSLKKQAEEECKQAINTRIANNFIAIKNNELEPLHYFNSFEMAHIIIQIGKTDQIESQRYLCQFWDKNISAMIHKGLTKNLPGNSGDTNIVDSMDFKQGIKTFNSLCE